MSVKSSTVLFERMVTDRRNELNMLASQAIRNLTQDAFDTYSDDQIIAQLLSDFGLGQVTVDFAVGEQVETALVGSQATIVLEFPLDGNASLVLYRPCISAKHQPVAGELTLDRRIRILATGINPEDFQRSLDEWKAKIAFMVAEVNKNAAYHDKCDEEQWRRHIGVLRKQYEALDQLVASLPYPLKRREAPEALKLPIEPKRVLADIREFNSTGDGQRYYLPDAEYEFILHTLSSMAKACEYSRQTFQKLSENDLRNLMLVTLNSHYHGQAGAETFNGEGKTDILIRHNAHNVFVGECKFWEGQKAFDKALDQLMGYINWRDTKAALIVFNRQQDFDSVLSKIAASAKAHSNFVSVKPSTGESEFRFVFRHPNHPSRHFDLAVLAFDVTANSEVHQAILSK